MDEIAALMMPWGWPRNVGRMYGYLLLAPEPVTLDKMAADLRIAKSNASVAARILEQFGNARRHSEPGSKRIYYSAPDVVAGPFASKTELFDRIVGLLAANHAIGRTAEVNARLKGMADFYRDIREAVQGVLDRYGDHAANPQNATASARDCQAGSGSRSADTTSSFGRSSATRTR